MPRDYSNQPTSDKPPAPASAEYDLRGVPCPLSWAKAKVRLEQLDEDAVLIVRLDDAKGARDLPRAAEASGYVVLDVLTESTEWRIVIQR